MSSINYNNINTNNQIPLQDPNAPPSRQGNQFYYRNRGNQFYNQNGGNRFNYQRYPRNYYRRNIFYNRNYRIPRQFFNPYETGGYGFVNPRQQRQGRSVQPVRSSSRRRPSNRPRRRGPRQIRLNDFMPTELRESSPNLPSEFNIATTTAPITTAPITTTVTTNATTDALPQREIFARRNTTQPFTVNENYQNQRVQQQQGNQRQRFLAPAIINEANIQLTEEEHQLLKWGPKFIFNDPKTAARRRITELATLKRKIEKCFLRKKVSPGRPVQLFIAELDVLLQTLHNISTTSKNLNKILVIENQMNQNDIIELLNSQASQSQALNGINGIKVKKKKNYGRLVKRLKHKFKLANVILQKSDKSKVFHLGKVEDYRKKSKEYMDKTQAYQCLGINDPLFELIQRTNKYLLDLRLAKWITQKQYELLSIKPNEVELAHLYYLPKAHKPGTPLRPIISGLKHPTIKISKFLDDLLRPLFDKMAQETTVTSGFELVKKLQKWSILNMNGNTIFCTIDVVDLYTMIPQVEGVLSLKKMLDYLKLKKVGGLRVETIIRLSRFVMQNNYFSYDGQFYHQIRGGAMGSPLTLTMANCYMFFFERQIVKQIKNSGGLYFRYIDDLFIVINWPARHLLKQIDKWKNFDENIKLNPNINSFATFLDLYMENRDGVLFTTVYQKPSYEPYYLPFNSIHPLHMKKNIPFTMLLRVIRYCSTFQTYLDEREKLRMALLFNKYPNKLIEEQFNNVLLKLQQKDMINKRIVVYETGTSATEYPTLCRPGRDTHIQIPSFAIGRDIYICLGITDIT
ncbi:unnamed protein product [Rotaria sordida]|uniref:Reverse transcriptase domain-containing protein n=2 Tax=Rotaria sordida TaxID=392033 RepID=A0A815KRI7_9BILA|nr:unnamed protein product [Rotaria sordida]